MSDNTPDEPRVTRFWHELYIEMMSNPLDNRTDKAFCDEHQIGKSTLELWKQKNRQALFSEIDRRRKNYLKEMRAVGMKALMRKCVDETKALELLLKITGDLVDRSEQVIENRTQDEKLKRINALLDSIGKKKASWKKADSSSEPGNSPDPLGGNESGGTEPSSSQPKLGPAEDNV